MTTSTSDLTAFLADARRITDHALASWADRVRAERPGPVSEAVAYSLRGPGKRLRPALVIAGFRELGGEGDVSDVAAAVEVVHTYSLVHDDLPCMDDDDLRRGRPTTHRAFDPPTAAAAGLAMVPLAARVLAEGAGALGVPRETLSRMGIELFGAAGGAGMIGGQVLDLGAEGRPVSQEELREIHRMKTGALITASVVLGALAAGSPPDAVEALRAYGGEVGVAFQIADDVLDATGTSQQLGKTAGKDAKQQKATFATILGTEAARDEARRRVDRAVARLREGGVDSPLLVDIATFMVDRRS